MNQTRIILAACALLLLTIGLLLGLFLSPATAPRDAGPTSAARGDGAADIAALQRMLDQEREARAALAAKLAAVSARLDALAAARDPGTPPPTPTPHSEIPPSVDNKPAIDEQVLLAAGISPGQVAGIRRQLESLEMERLYLRDQATREGWMGSARYVEELEKLGSRRQQIRDQLGEDNYGAYLYAMGEPNQVLVGSVIGNSPAAKAGLRAGDVLISYAGRRIYTWSDLRQASTGGSPDEQVQVLIQRGQEQLDAWMKRGPLGIRLEVRSEPPGR